MFYRLASIPMLRVWSDTFDVSKYSLSYTVTTLTYRRVNDLSPVHTNNNVEATGNDVERVQLKISSFRQSREKLNMLSLFRLCRKNLSTCSISYDNVDPTLWLVWTGPCGLTACTPGSAPGQTLGNEYGSLFLHSSAY